MSVDGERKLTDFEAEILDFVSRGERPTARFPHSNSRWATQAMGRLARRGFVNDAGITEAGLAALRARSDRKETGR